MGLRRTAIHVFPLQGNCNLHLAISQTGQGFFLEEETLLTKVLASLTFAFIIYHQKFHAISFLLDLC